MKVMKKGMKRKKKEVKKPLLKASYCMPNYNKVEYLADAIDSFLEQDYENKELIIGDDSSTDKSMQLINWYANEHPNLIKVFYSNENIGVANMRNKLIEMASGDIIFNIDSDDMIETRRTQEAMKVFESKPGVDIVYGDCALLNGMGQHTDNIISREMQVWMIKTSNFIPNSTLAFRKSIPVRYRPNLRFIDDWYFHMDCIKAGLKFEYIPKILGVYRLINSGLTLDGGFETYEKLAAKEALKKEFADFDDDISENLANKEHQRIRIKRILKEIPKGSKVLDLGANGGYLASCLIQKGCKVKCFEIASNLVEVCKKKGLDVELKDARDFNIENEYDIVLAGDILEHMPEEDVKKVLDNSYKALKTGGKLIATVPYKHSFYNADRVVEHVKDYDVNDFKRLFFQFHYKAEGIYAGDDAVSIWLFVTGDKK